MHPSRRSIVDVMMPEYRGSGLGYRLHNAVAERVPPLLALTMAPGCQVTVASPVGHFADELPRLSA
jgi:hypothetical protein